MRTKALYIVPLVLGILIGAGGCSSSDSPTAPLAPSRRSEQLGGFLGSGNKQDSTAKKTHSGPEGDSANGDRPDTEASARGGYIITGS